MNGRRFTRNRFPFIFVAKGMDVVAARADLGNFIQLDNGAVAFTTYSVFR